MKKILFLLLAFSLLLCGCSLTAETAPQESSEEPSAEESEKILATIKVRDFGEIKLELYEDVAPQSVYNFCSLARQGFYDGLIFHRVIKGFMIQGGDPTGKGIGGSGYCIKGEFILNNVKNELHHDRGVISMARSQDYNSASSQFFIMHKEAKYLDGSYAAFGRVIEGMEVVDAIAGVSTNSYSDKPYKDVVIESITISGPELPEPEKLPDPYR